MRTRNRRFVLAAPAVALLAVVAFVGPSVVGVAPASHAFAGTEDDAEREQLYRWSAALLGRHEPSREEAVAALSERFRGRGPDVLQWLGVASAKDAPEVRAAVDRVLRAAFPGKVPEVAAHLEDLDEKARVAAARVLGSLGPDAAPAVPALAEALYDTAPVATAAAGALGRIGSAAAAAAPDLDILARAGEPESVAASAVAALARVGDAARVSALLREPGRRSVAWEGLKVAGPEAVPTFATLLRDRSWHVRAAAANVLAFTAPESPEVPDLLAGAARDQAPAVRLAALAGLARVARATTASVAAAGVAVSDAEARVRSAAVLALHAAEGLPEARAERLAGALGSEDALVRLGAARALYALALRDGSVVAAGTPVASALRRAVDDPSPDTATAASLALLARGARDEALLVSAVRAVAGETWGEWTEVPMSLPPFESPGTLRAGRSQQGPAVAAEDALRTLVAAGAPALASLRATLRAEARVARAHAGWCVAAFGPDAEPYLVAALGDTSPWVRVVAAIALAGGARDAPGAAAAAGGLAPATAGRAATILAETLRDALAPDRDVREWFLWWFPAPAALVALGAPAVAPVAEALSREDVRADANRRRPLLTVLARLAPTSPAALRAFVVSWTPPTAGDKNPDVGLVRGLPPSAQPELVALLRGADTDVRRQAILVSRWLLGPSDDLRAALHDLAADPELGPAARDALEHIAR